MTLSEVKQLAKKLAELLKHSTEKQSLVIALVGELGAGKTTFAKSLLKSLGVRQRVTSPTFTLIKKYKSNIYHIDAYRINKPSDLIKLGFQEIVDGKGNIVIVEWADKIKRLISQNAVWIYFYHSNKPGKRVIKVAKNSLRVKL